MLELFTHADLTSLGALLTEDPLRYQMVHYAGQGTGHDADAALRIQPVAEAA